ncbi:MAG: futalosine hydrolase [Bacteroidales bacterium]|nr:futalosine hydrolase [Bacteroidales bacterium]
MRILIISATVPEIQPVLSVLKITNNRNSKLKFYKYKDLCVDVLISGVGIPSTTYYVVKNTQHIRYNLVINSGIAGSFNPEIKVGDVVNVMVEQFGDIGVEDNEEFLTSFELKLEDPNVPPWINGRLFNDTTFNVPAIERLKKVKGMTVNKAHGCVESIARIKSKLNPDVETMEGAAVFYSCLMEKLSFYEIRAISNFVEPRNKKNWEVPLAITNLNTTMIRILEELNSML